MNESLDLLRYPLLFFSFVILITSTLVVQDVPPGEFWILSIALIVIHISIELLKQIDRIRFTRGRSQDDIEARHEAAQKARQRRRQEMDAANQGESTKLNLYLLEGEKLSEEKIDAAAEVLKKTPSGAHHVYSRLALESWNGGLLQKSVEFAEKAIATYSETDDTDEGFMLGLENSLAYYYADEGSTENADKARDLIKGVVNRRRAADDPQLGSSIATQGFVMIRFASSPEEVLTGLGLCIEGWELGSASEKLCLRHLRSAENRIEELQLLQG